MEKCALGEGTYEVGGGDILIHDLDHEVVANVLDVDVEDLVPLGGLAAALDRPRLELLLASFQNHERVHLRKEFRVARQTSFDNFDAQAS